MCIAMLYIGRAQLTTNQNKSQDDGGGESRLPIVDNYAGGGRVTSWTLDNYCTSNVAGLHSARFESETEDGRKVRKIKIHQISCESKKSAINSQRENRYRRQ